MNSRSRVYIIAEAGVNHNGDILLAKKLVDIAIEAGVDAVKFQTWKTELIASKDVPMADYQIQNTGVQESQFDMLKRLELSYDEFRQLKDYCDEKGIVFLSTADEEESAIFLNELQGIFKIGSGELTNVPLLRKIGSFGKPVILSTGMGTIDDIELAIQTLYQAGLDAEDITLLHVTTEYPTPMDEVNLRAMGTLKKRFNVKVGYSDHTMGIEVPIAAVAVGAQVIEKHFTIDRSMKGPDHAASMEPAELYAMVKAIRNIELALGTGEKVPTKSELKNKEVVQRGIVAVKIIKKGEELTSNNIGLRRIKGGIGPKYWDCTIGTKAKKDYNIGDLI
jgi:N-acetylneuraminate synthase